MNVLSEVFDKTVDLLKTPQLHEDWKMIEADLKKLLQTDGPAGAHSQVLDNLRDVLEKAAEKSGVKEEAMAKEILRVIKKESLGFQDRAALVKQMQHFYRVQKKGGQDIWVMDQPKEYNRWDYDLFHGKTSTELEVILAKNNEIFGSGNRTTLSDALQLARKWSADCEVKLGVKSETTLDCIGHWFFEPGASATELEGARSTLLAGFKKITSACNSSKVIFSDRPHLRTDGKHDNTYASVNDMDALPVIYVFQLFIKTGRRNILGKIPRLWLCALTIIHELSHKFVKTDDFRYDYEGLKPSPSFPSSDAIKNADSWAYFCGDLLGYVPDTSVKEAYS